MGVGCVTRGETVMVVWLTLFALSGLASVVGLVGRTVYYWRDALPAEWVDTTVVVGLFGMVGLLAVLVLWAIVGLVAIVVRAMFRR